MIFRRRCKVRVVGIWEPEFPPTQGKPFPGTTFFECVMRFRDLPQPGDDIVMEKGRSDGTGQTVGVAERVFGLDGSVTIYTSGFGGWDKEHVEELFCQHEDFEAEVVR